MGTVKNGRPRFALVICMATAVLLGSCSKSESAGVVVPRPEPGTVEKIDSRQGRALLDGDRRVLLLDVRTLREYMLGHVVGAQIGDMADQERWDFRLSELDHNEPVMVYCRDAKCSSEAAELLVEAGFKEVYDLGYPGMWDSKYLPIDKRGKS